MKNIFETIRRLRAINREVYQPVKGPNYHKTPVGIKVKATPIGLFKWSWLYHPEARPLLGFMLIPITGSILFALTTLTHWDVWLDKRTHLTPAERDRNKKMADLEKQQSQNQK